VSYYEAEKLAGFDYYPFETLSRIATDNVNKSYLSPYQFASNSPTNKFDPDGKDEIHFHFLGSYTSYGSGGWSRQRACLD